MAKRTRHTGNKPHVALKRIFRMTGLMLLCWCAFFACSEAAVLTYDAIVKRLVE
ncbi:hypothetical protein GRF59_20695 [Paenibacillus sp. HJL G12]|uniref:Uncharacterized protein n=1 Tax=Paenibacillus dendrobii TaxID=2691084 RepID=A0A7X3LIE1_9BACL|nr:hypothetical protein [Paenibacillus dendrobii]MWV46042.1 hypothetical protein [Paenibacillus dendrobii]